MIKKQVDEILAYQRKRRNKKIRLGIISIITLMIGSILVSLYFRSHEKYYLNYTEEAFIDYRVNLKENEFYETEYLGPDRNVIACLIKNIDTNFYYQLNLGEDISYTYEYRIYGVVSVKEKSASNLLYETEREIKSGQNIIGNSSEIAISENFEINYDEYNDVMKKFITTYGIEDAESSLTIQMDVKVFEANSGKQINDKDNVLSLEIPLTTNTIEIGMVSKTVKGVGTVLIHQSQTPIVVYVLFGIGIIFIIVSLVYFYKLIAYIIQTRSAETMYEKQLKRILNNYRTYIQKITDKIAVDEDKVMHTDSFNELLEIRDTIQKPILMIQESKYATKFYILTEGTAFLYSISATEIREELKAQAKLRQEKNEKK